MIGGWPANTVTSPVEWSRPRHIRRDEFGGFPLGSGAAVSHPALHTLSNAEIWYDLDLQRPPIPEWNNERPDWFAVKNLGRTGASQDGGFYAINSTAGFATPSELFINRPEDGYIQSFTPTSLTAPLTSLSQVPLNGIDIEFEINTNWWTHGTSTYSGRIFTMDGLLDDLGNPFYVGFQYSRYASRILCYYGRNYEFFQARLDGRVRYRFVSTDPSVSPITFSLYRWQNNSWVLYGSVSKTAVSAPVSSLSANTIALLGTGGVYQFEGRFYNLHMKDGSGNTKVKIDASNLTEEFASSFVDDTGNTWTVPVDWNCITVPPAQYGTRTGTMTDIATRSYVNQDNINRVTGKDPLTVMMFLHVFGGNTAATYGLQGYWRLSSGVSTGGCDFGLRNDLANVVYATGPNLTTGKHVLIGVNDPITRTMALYVDGVKVATTAYTASAKLWTEDDVPNVNPGGHYLYSTAFWKRALSERDILEIARYYLNTKP